MINYYEELKKYLEAKNYQGRLAHLETIKNRQVDVIKMYNQYKPEMKKSPMRELFDDNLNIYPYELIDTIDVATLDRSSGYKSGKLYEYEFFTKDEVQYNVSLNIDDKGIARLDFSALTFGRKGKGSWEYHADTLVNNKDTIKVFNTMIDIINKHKSDIKKLVILGSDSKRTNFYKALLQYFKVPFKMDKNKIIATLNEQNTSNSRGKVFTIKSEDKAAFINRLDKMGIPVDTYKIHDNVLDDSFSIEFTNPESIKMIVQMLKQSPKIDVIKERLGKLLKKVYTDKAVVVKEAELDFNPDELEWENEDQCKVEVMEVLPTTQYSYLTARVKTPDCDVVNIEFDDYEITDGTVDYYEGEEMSYGWIVGYYDRYVFYIPASFTGSEDDGLDMANYFIEDIKAKIESEENYN